MMLYSGSAARLRPLCSVCRSIWSEHSRFQLKYTAASASLAANNKGRSKRGRFSRNAKSFDVNEAQLKNLLDDEPYFDRDFDYVDHQQLALQRKLAEKYLPESDPLNSPKAILGRKYRNALYEDDEDDLKLAQVKLNAGNNKQAIKKLHREFEAEEKARKNLNVDLKATNAAEISVQDSNALAKSRIEKKKERRVLIDLPYDITMENRFDVLNQLVIPLHKTPYHVQLKQKQAMCADVLRKLGRKLQQMDGPVRVDRSGLACPLEPTRPSPVTERYRNKDEFSVWPGVDGNSRTVGFFVGQPSLHRQVVCVEPNLEKMIISKQSHIELAGSFQHYLRQVSPGLDYCQNYGDAGHWRRLSVRSNRLQQHMLTVNLHPQELTEEQLREEADRLREFFAGDSRVSSLYLHTSRNTRSTHSSESERYYHLAGSETLSEMLFDRQFAISPSSFFQINTAAAEVLYRVIMTEVAATNGRRRQNATTLLDLCCGTGTLALLMAGHVKQVIAIDQSPAAIEDARRNAQANGVHNVTFLVGTVEELLPKLVEEGSQLSGHVVAVANPSRRGLHPRAIRTLRRMDYIQRLVYVSCKADGDAFLNFVSLCRPRADSGSPFMPVNAIPVDLFPHTPHCELVLTFERF